MLQSPHSAGGSAPHPQATKARQIDPETRAALILEQGVVTSHFSKTALAIIRKRNLAKIRREREQRKLIEDDTLWHDQILTKLQTEDRIDPVTGRWFAPTAQMENFARCGHDQIYRTCIGCDETTAHVYHCMIKWCPRCNWRITSRRRELLKQWLPTIAQPKHIVTTQRNRKTLTRAVIKDHTKNLARLRRSEVFSQVKGGCVSVEITNESRGWHLHAHWLVDARWVDQYELSRTWGKLVGQDFAIVKVIDCRKGERGTIGGERVLSPSGTPLQGNYERELMKYVVKGSALARWPAQEIADFVAAVRAQRFFFCFGDLFKRARKLRAQM